MDSGDIYILVGCEESQAICLELRKLGFSAFSCDLKPCSGGHSEYHLQMDVFKAIALRKWHGAIFHPDCTYLTVSGLHWNGRVSGRPELTELALQFVCDLLNCGIPHIGLENPMGCISTRIYKCQGLNFYNSSVFSVHPSNIGKMGFKPAQIIQPYRFGDNASKKTGLWTINLPQLKPTEYYPPRIVDGKKRWGNQTDSGQNKLGPSEQRKEIRSKTYPGIAKAIAEQWGKFILNSPTNKSAFYQAV